MDDSFFNMFTDLGDFMFLDAKNQYELPEWDRPQPTFTLVRAQQARATSRTRSTRVRTLIHCAAQIALMVQSVFFLFTVVILMNLLIAMMGQT